MALRRALQHKAARVASRRRETSSPGLRGLGGGVAGALLVLDGAEELGRALLALQALTAAGEDDHAAVLRPPRNAVEDGGDLGGVEGGVPVVEGRREDPGHAGSLARQGRLVPEDLRQRDLEPGEQRGRQYVLLG